MFNFFKNKKIVESKPINGDINIVDSIIEKVTTKTEEIDYSKMSPKAIKEMLIAAGRVQALPGEATEVGKDD